MLFTSSSIRCILCCLIYFFYYLTILFSFDPLFVCLFVCMVKIWQLKFNPLPTIQLSSNFAGVRSLDDNEYLKKN